MTFIPLHLRTEFSFRKAFGKVEEVLAVSGNPPYAAMTDAGCWGHVSWAKACKAASVKPIFGVGLLTVSDARTRERQPGAQTVLLAKTNDGLRALYELVSKANSPEQFYYVPRLGYADLNELHDGIAVLLGPGTQLDRLRAGREFYLMLTPTNPAWNRVAMRTRERPKVIAGDNHYPRPEDAGAYGILAGRDKVTRPTPMHILSEDELRLAVPEADDEAFLNTERIAAECVATLPKAENVRIDSPRTLRDLCMDGAIARGMRADSRFGLADTVYNDRLNRELDMIHSKNFADYFYLVGDLVRWAKQHMLVGPARGSSAGSLVCYLLGITDVDPIVHDLMFERFIDVTRADLPDIDIDFQDTRRDLVVDYLRTTYGAERVGRIGTVARLKAKSCLGDVAKELGIPAWEIRDVQDAVIERSTGDARAQFAVKDALETLEIGKALLVKYPAMAIAGRLEGHAQHSGKHAAGVMVSQYPISHYCATGNDGTSQIDKKDAETLNLLKIDALGLRVLSVIQDTLDQIGKTRDWLVNYPLDDEAAFEIVNDERYAGIFQYEGYALQSLCRDMKVHSFEDLQVIGALARPGPLHSGASGEFIARRTGRSPVIHMHPLVEPITRSTYGMVTYQEQVMAIARTVGQLSWGDVSELRKAMSKSLGDEFFNHYRDTFIAGAASQGIAASAANQMWLQICTHGSWSYNRSHSLSYGIITYWTCMLKAHHPLQFAAACLRNEKDTEQSVRVLRDLANEGFAYKPVDIEKSTLEWSVVDGVLVGGLTNIKGIGLSKAKDILARRAEGRALLPGQRKLLSEPKTPYDDIFEAARRFGMLYKEPKAHGVVSGPVTHIADIGESGEYVFIARLKEKNLRDMNEYNSVQKRGGRMIKRAPLFLNLTLEDDTGSIKAKVGRFDYKKWGDPIIQKAKMGEWFLWKGSLRDDGWRVVNVDRWRALDETSALYKAPPQQGG